MSYPSIDWIQQSSIFSTTRDDVFDGGTTKCASDASGNLYFVYTTSGVVSGDTAVGTDTGGTDIVLVKTNSSGSRLFARQYSISGTANENFPSIAVESNGTVYISCTTTGTLSGGTNVTSGTTNDVAVVKLDTNGNVQWIKQDNTIVGSTSTSQSSIGVDNNGGVYLSLVIANSPPAPFPTGQGGTEVYIIKLAASTGARQWTIGGSDINSTSNESTPRIVVDSNFIYLVYVAPNTGIINGGQTNVGSTDIVVSKFNTSDGARQWIATGPQISTTAADADPAIAVDSNGNVFVGYNSTAAIQGQTASGNSDIIVMKLDANGNRIWIHQNSSTSTPNNDSFGPKLAVDFAGDVYIGYITNGAVSGDQVGNFVPSLGIFEPAIQTSQVGDVVIAKLSGVDGSRIWASQKSIFNTPQAEVLPFISIAPGTKTLRIVYETSGSTSGGSNLQQQQIDAIVCQFDSNGTLTATLQNSTWNTSGLESNIVVRLDTSGNIYLAYITDGGTVSGGTSGAFSDVVIAKFDSNRNVLWIKQSNLYSTPNTENYLTMSIDASQNVFLAYSSNSTPSGAAAGLGSSDIVLMKLDSNGNRVWVNNSTAPNQTFINTSQQQERPHLQTDTSGNVYLAYRTQGAVSGGIYAGGSGSDVVVSKFNTNGVRQWVAQNNTISTTGDDVTSDGIRIAVDSSTGSVYLTYMTPGTISGATSRGSGDTVLIKLNSSGIREWGIQSADVSTSGVDYASNVCVDPSGNVYFVTSVIQAVSGGTMTGPTSQYDIAVVKFNSSGVKQWTIQNSTLNTSVSELNPDIVSDGVGNIYLAYNTRGTTSGNTRANEGFQNTDRDVVIAKISWAGSIEWVKQNPIFNTQYEQSTASIAVSADGTKIFVGFQGYPANGGTYNNTNSEDIVLMQMTDYVLPSRPTTLEITNPSANSATLKWNMSSLGDIPLVSYYMDIQRNYASVGSLPALNNIIPIANVSSLGSNQYQTTLALPGHGDYTLSLWAYNGAGISPTSTPVSFTTNSIAPSSPQNLEASGRDGTLYLTWDAPQTSFASSYNVSLTLNGATISKTVNTPFTSFTGLINGETYTISIQAVNTSGTSEAATTTYIPTPTPTPLAIVEWVKQDTTMNGSGHDARWGNATRQLATDSQGNVYCVYGSTGSISGTSGKAGRDIFLVKVSPSGARVWIRRFTITTNTTDDSYSIAIDLSDNIIIAYTSTDGGVISGGTASGGYDMAIQKLDANGNIIWTKQDISVNTSANEDTYYITIDRENSIYISYTTYGTVSGGLTNQGQGDVVVLKLNSNGNIIFIKQDMELNSSGDVLYAEIGVDDSLNMYFFIRSSSALSGTTAVLGQDLYLLKYDQYWNRLWAAQTNLISTTLDEGFRQFMKIDKGGNIYIVYSTSGVVSGANAPVGGGDIILQKFDTNGNRIWINNSNSINSTLGDSNPMIDLDRDGNVYLVYNSLGMPTGVSGAGSGSADIIVAKFDTNGNRIWSMMDTALGSPNDDQFASIAVYSSNQIYISYQTHGSISGKTSAGNADTVIARIGQYFVPDAPVITSTSNTDTSITINFTAPADGGKPITAYKYSLDGGVTFQTAAQTSSPIIINSGISIANEYTVQIRGVNSVGDGVASSSTVVPINGLTPISAPTLSTADASGNTLNGGLRLSWTAPAALGYTITDYEILDASDNITTVSATAAAGTTQSYTFTGLGATNRTYRVRAKDSGANFTGSASPISSTVFTVYLAQPVLTINRSHLALQLSWPALNSQTTPPTVQGQILSATYAVLDGSDNVVQSNLSQNYFNITSGLTGGDSYTYKIQAQANGLTTVSDPVSKNVPVVPKPIANTPELGNAQTTISWNNVSNEVREGTFKGYKIYFSVNGGPETQTALIAQTTTTIDLSLLGVSGLSGTLSFQLTSATFTGLTNGALYEYRIVSVVEVDSINRENTSDAIRAIPIAPTVTVQSFADSLTTAAVDKNDVAAAVNATNNALLTSNNIIAAGSLNNLANSTDSNVKAAAGSIFVGLPTVSAKIMLESLAITGINMATILEQAVSADAAQVGTAIAALDTLEERKTAVQAAVAHITSLSTSIIAAAAQTGIITTETVAKAVGASDILARISISALKNPVGDNDVITPFDQAITDITTSTSTQKIAIAESAADTILKQAKSVITDNTASDAEKAAAAANTVAAVLYGANKADDLKNTLITAIIDNFAGETINLGDRRALSLVDSIPASRINKWAFTGIAETLVVVPNNNIIEITTIPPAEYHPIPNQFLAMILGETYTFKNKNNLADTPVSGIYKEDASTGIRYLDFSATGTAALNDPDTLRLGDYITLFNKTFVMSAAASASISDDIPNPDTPSIISTTATSLTVQWYNPSIYGGQSDGGYNIYYKLDTDTKYTSFLPSVSYTNLASGYTKEITGLIPAKQYTIKIATYFDYSLNQESTGATVQGTTSNSVPAAPTNIQTTSTTDSITITSFTAGADNGATITGYEYALNSQSATPVSVSTSPLIGFTITDLQPNTSYTIYLRAINSEGYGLWGSTIKLTLPEAAIAPYSTNQTTTSITLQWNNPTQGTESSGYKIYYKLDSEPNYSASPVLTTTSSSPAASTANITSLTSNTTYDFKITSYNSGGENSLYALVENISTLIDAPSNPTIISATPGQKTITVVWQAPMTGTVPTGYYIYYKISSVLIYPTPPIDAGLVTTYTITGLSSSVSYDVKIVAYNGSATSEGVESTNILTLLSAPTGPSTSGSPYAAPNLAHTAIEVNFEITIDGDSGLSVFGEKAIGPTNVIVAECPLPVNALYDDTTKKALIELWEPKDDPTNIAVQLANTPAVEQDEYDLTDGYKITLKTFAKGLQKVLCDKFDCKTAAPFNSSKYKSSSGEVISEYTTQRDFGRVALGAFAHYLFGHVDATSGITNDVEFLKNMLTLTETGADDAVIDEDDTTGPVNRYEAYSANVKSEIDTAAITTWTNTDGTAQDANLARRLVAAVVNKGFNTNGTLKISKMEDNTLSTAERKKELAYIVRQVVGQDATRLMNEDNSEGTLNIHRPLRFYEGDVIYLNIKLNAPQVSMTVEPGISAETFENSFPPQNYTLKITLGPREEL